MQIRIKKNAQQAYHSRYDMRYSNDWSEILQKISGMVLEVETKFLYKDQFNTKPIEGISELGLRVEEYLVEEVIDDIRIFKQRCNWCGKHSSSRLDTCPHCKYKSYLEKLSDAPNAIKFIFESNEEVS